MIFYVRISFFVGILSCMRWRRRYCQFDMAPLRMTEATLRHHRRFDSSVFDAMPLDVKSLELKDVILWFMTFELRATRAGPARQFSTKRGEHISSELWCKVIYIPQQGLPPKGLPFPMECVSHDPLGSLRKLRKFWVSCTPCARNWFQHRRRWASLSDAFRQQI